MHNLLSNHMILPLEVCLGDMRCFRNPRLRWSAPHHVPFRCRLRGASQTTRLAYSTSDIRGCAALTATALGMFPWFLRASAGCPRMLPSVTRGPHPPPAPGTTALPACLWIRLSGTLHAHGAPRCAVLPTGSSSRARRFPGSSRGPRAGTVLPSAAE